MIETTALSSTNIHDTDSNNNNAGDDKSSNEIAKDNGNQKPSNISTEHFARRRWSQALALADELRKNTQLKKTEKIRKLTFEIPSVNEQEVNTMTSVEMQTARVNSYQNELLFARTGNFTLDSLTENFLRLKVTFDRMHELNKNDFQRVALATTIAKTALLIVFRATESIVEIVTKGTRNFPNLSSLISYIRSCHAELPIHGYILVDWYKAAQMLDLLLNDSDWLVQPQKAEWAMKVCNETLAWTRVVFNESYRKAPVGRPIFDREDSIRSFQTQDLE